MKNRASSSLHSLAPLLGSLALMFTPAHGSEISKLSNATALSANNGFVVTGLVTAQKILHHSLGR